MRGGRRETEQCEGAQRRRGCGRGEARLEVSTRGGAEREHLSVLSKARVAPSSSRRRTTRPGGFIGLPTDRTECGLDVSCGSSSPPGDTSGDRVLNRTHRLKRLPDMTKSPRTRDREVLQLVEEPARTGEEVAAVDAPTAAVESFEDFYRREFPRLLVLARALAGDLAAEDVAQESMVVTYRDWSRISAMRSPVGYVRGICTHKAVSAMRRHLAERRAVR